MLKRYDVPNKNKSIVFKVGLSLPPFLPLLQFGNIFLSPTSPEVLIWFLQQLVSRLLIVWYTGNIWIWNQCYWSTVEEVTWGLWIYTIRIIMDGADGNWGSPQSSKVNYELGTTFFNWCLVPSQISSKCEQFGVALKWNPKWEIFLALSTIS